MVHFVGAGPGAADLLTVRGMRLLARAGCVIYAGSLVNPALLAYAPEAAGEEALSRVMGLYTPESPDRDSWRVRERFAETGAEALIFAEDSTCTQLLTRDRALLEMFCRHEPRAAVRELAEG